MSRHEDLTEAGTALRQGGVGSRSVEGDGGEGGVRFIWGFVCLFV